MNASDDEVFEDTVESLAAEKEGVIENLEIKVHTTTMAPKSATKSTYDIIQRILHEEN